APWASGLAGPHAPLHPRAAAWAPGWDTAAAAATLAIDLLLMRAIDDIRDLDYDRLHSPGRPLAAGQVRVPDLAGLYAVGAAVILALNAPSTGAAAVVARHPRPPPPGPRPAPRL